VSSKNKNVISVFNPKCGLPKKVLTAMNARRDAHIADLRGRAARLQQLRPTDEERQIRQDLRSSLLALTGLREEDAERISKLQRTRVEQIRDAIRPEDKPPHLLPLDPAPIAGEAELWWAQTYITVFNVTGLIAFFQDDGVHLAGSLVCRTDNLQKSNVTVVSQFGLGPDRMPSGNGVQFISNPVAELYGQLSGLVRGNGYLDFGDQWAKCWLNTSQTLYSGIPLPFHIASGFSSETRTLIFIERTVDADAQWATFPGLFALPPVGILLTDRTHPIQVDLQFSFDFQLEGDAEIDIGVIGANDSAVLRTHQWKITPA
jgi:hypothetical protein